MQKRKNDLTRILFIGTTDRKGGAASLGWELANNLSINFSAHHLVGTKYSSGDSCQQLRQPFPSKYISSVGRYQIAPLIRYARSYLLANDIDFGAGSEILGHPWYQKADIVHLHNLHGSYFKLDTLRQMDKEKKVIWTLHDTWAVTSKCAQLDDPHNWQPQSINNCRLSSYPPMLWNNTKYLWNKKKSIYNQLHNTHIVAPSRWLDNIVGDSILSHLPHRLIYNGIDTSKFLPGNKVSKRKELDIPVNKKVVIMVGEGGKKNPYKGWDYAEKILSKREDLFFISVGGTHVQSSNYLGIPSINREELISYYQASDALLFPSVAENCPLVVLEAMSCGLPVISFDVGGIPELVQHKINGYVAKYKDGKDLEAGLNWIFSQSVGSLSTISSNNHTRVVNNFSLNNMISQYESLYIQ